MKRSVKILIAVVLLALLAGPALAVTSRAEPVTYTESTFGGVTRDYTSLQTWEDRSDNNLVASGKGWILTCYADKASYDQRVIIAGATVDANYFRVIRAAPGHERRVVFDYTGTTSYATADVSEAYFGLYDLTIKQHKSDTTLTYYFTVILSGVGQRVSGCVIGPSSTTDTGVTSATGIYAFTGADALTISNTVVLEHLSYNHAAELGINLNGGAGKTAAVYNTLVTNCKTGITQTSGTVTAVNTIIRNATTTTSGTVGATTCLFTTDPGTSTFAPDGYHMLTGPDAIGKGTDLSATFTDDIDGETRTGLWDIGPDETFGGSQVMFFW